MAVSIYYLLHKSITTYKRNLFNQSTQWPVSAKHITKPKSTTAKTKRTTHLKTLEWDTGVDMTKTISMLPKC